MGYRTKGIVGIIVGILFIPVALIGFIVIFRSLALLRLAARRIEPGTDAETCTKHGHDWRPSVSPYPAGTTCRNCLARKDGAMLAWRYAPAGIAVLPYHGTPYFVPYNAPKQKRKRSGGAPRFIEVDVVPPSPEEVKIEIVGFGRP